MPRNYGYAIKGERCYGSHDCGSKGRTNAIGALIGNRLLTISLFDCNVDTAVFSIWLKQDLLPKLPQGSVLVMDNASFHKNKLIEEEVKKAGHFLEYLPSYSPDLNPIEHKWAQAKSRRRKLKCDIDTLFKEDYL